MVVPKAGFGNSFEIQEDRHRPGIFQNNWTKAPKRSRIIQLGIFPPSHVRSRLGRAPSPLSPDFFVFIERFTKPGRRLCIPDLSPLTPFLGIPNLAHSLAAYPKFRADRFV